MAGKSERLQIMVDQDRAEVLKDAASKEGVSISEIGGQCIPPAELLAMFVRAKATNPSLTLKGVLWGAFYDRLQEITRDATAAAYERRTPEPEPAALAQQMQKMLAACDGAQANTKKALEVTDGILGRLADLEVSSQNMTVFLKYLLFETEAAGRESELQKKLVRLLAESGVSAEGQEKALQAIGLDQIKKE